MTAGIAQTCLDGATGARLHAAFGGGRAAARVTRSDTP